MISSIAPRKNAKQEEADQKRAELQYLEQIAADLELEFASLNRELFAFEIRYLKRVGKLITELDRIEALIAELLSLIFPNQEVYAEKAAQAKEKAKKSADEADYANSQPLEKTKFTPSEDLKKLYRDVAKQVHPDLAADEEDRARRQELMKEANQAFAEGDKEKLKEIWSLGVQTDPEDRSQQVFKQLNQKIRKIRIRIELLRQKIKGLESSDLHRLMIDVIHAEKHGGDLLYELAEHLSLRILQSNIRLEALRKEYEQSQPTN